MLTRFDLNRAQLCLRSAVFRAGIPPAIYSFENTAVDRCALRRPEGPNSRAAIFRDSILSPRI